MDIDARIRVLEDPDVPSDFREKAWKVMLETRHLRVVSRALVLADSVKPSVMGLTPEQAVDAYLHRVGFTCLDDGLERLCPEDLHHIVFPEPFFEGLSRPPWLARVHPTWRLEPADALPPVQFGGHAEGDCPLCNGRLHRLVTLEPVPEGLGITGLGRLELATCLSCLGWERAPLFYRHEKDGRAVGVKYDGPTIVPQFPVGPLRESEVRLVATPHRWRWQDWGLSNGRENLNRIGGEPCWVQNAEYPRCPICGGLMKHLLQLDSDLPTADGGEWLWGSGGIGYVSWCDRCKISGHLWQCT